MSIGRATVVKLLTEAEFRVYEASQTGRVDDHGATRLGALITQARRLRDKFGQHASQQRAEARGKRDPRNQRVAQGDDNTRLKQEIFADVLARLEAARERAKDRANPDGPAPGRRAIKSSQRASAAKARRAAAAEEAASPKKKATKKPSKKKAATKKPSKKKATKKAATKKPSKKAATKKPSKKAAKKKAATKKAAKKKVSALAHDAKASVGAERARKPQVAAQKAILAHGAARGRRNQARRDGRG